MSTTTSSNLRPGPHFDVMPGEKSWDALVQVVLADMSSPREFVPFTRIMSMLVLGASLGSPMIICSIDVIIDIIFT
jgi:hypothetical protein